MGYKRILICDNPKCGKEITNNFEKYEIKPSYIFKSESFRDGGGSMDCNYVSLYFCEHCLEDLYTTFSELLKYWKKQEK